MPGCTICNAVDCRVTHLLLGNEAEALVKVGQSHEITVDEVDHRLNDAVTLI